MKKNIVHLSDRVMRALREAALQVGGMALDEVMTAAVWIFGRQDATTRNAILTSYLDGLLGGREPRRKRRTFKEWLHALGHRLHAAARRWFP